jgi:hypothetical protein
MDGGLNMKYARIENGEVREIINFNPKGKFVKEIEEQFVKCTEDTKQNDIYKYGKFSKPTLKELTQEELNQQITNEINSSNNELLEIFEDIVEWAKEKGFILSEQKKQLIDFRKEKRKGII